MPFDLARWHHRANKNFKTNGYNYCDHLKSKKNSTSQSFIEDKNYSNDNDNDDVINIECVPEKKRYEPIIEDICSGCIVRRYGRNIKYDCPNDCTSFFLDGEDGCEPCCSRFSHNSHIRPIASKEKWRGIYSKRRVLPQRMNKDVSISLTAKKDKMKILKKKKSFVDNYNLMEMKESIYY